MMVSRRKWTSGKVSHCHDEDCGDDDFDHGDHLRVLAGNETERYFPKRSTELGVCHLRRCELDYCATLWADKGTDRMSEVEEAWKLEGWKLMKKSYLVQNMMSVFLTLNLNGMKIYLLSSKRPLSGFCASGPSQIFHFHVW